MQTYISVPQGKRFYNFCSEFRFIMCSVLFQIDTFLDSVSRVTRLLRQLMQNLGFIRKMFHSVASRLFMGLI
jgi:hypothetical protein